MMDLPKAILANIDPGIPDEIDRELSNLATLQCIGRDAKDAFEQIKNHEPQFCFIDITDGSSSALALADRLKKDLAHVHLIFIAAEMESQTVLKALRMGAADYICRPIVSGAIRESFQRVIGHGEKTSKRAKVFSVSSRKGGMGVTTIAVNLADQISALTSKRVVLLDLKLKTGDTDIFCNLKDSYTTTDILKDMKRLDENLLLSSLVRHPRGFFVVSAPEDIKETQKIRPADLEKMMGVLQEYTDYIVADISNEYDPFSAYLIDISDKVFLLSQQTVPAIKALMKTLNLFDEVGYGADKVKVVLNRYSPKEDLDISDVAGIMGRDLFATVSDDHASVNGAINHGELIDDTYKESKVNQDLEKLTRKLLDIPDRNADNTGSNPLKRLISGVFKK